MKTKLRRYQKEGVAAIERFDGRALLADEMGLGKTIQSLTWMHMRNGQIKHTIVVCPASLKWNWEREAKTHLNMPSMILSGRKPIKTRPFCNLIIINYDILREWLPYLIKCKPELLILDEIQKIKNMQTKWSKYVQELSKHTKYVIGLSGTPMTNRPIELFWILHVIRPDLFPMTRWFDYVKKYCGPLKRRFGRWDTSGSSNLLALHRNLKRTCMIRRLKKDVLDELPPKSRYIVQVDLRNREEYDYAMSNFRSWIVQRYGQAKAYRSLRAEALVRAGYLKRLAARLKFRSVIEWINNYLETSSDKLIVAAIHRPAIDLLHKKFPNSVVIRGKVPAKHRLQLVDKFQHDPKTRVFIGNIQAAGIGLNLTVANVGVFAELGWTPGEHLQFEDRAHRIGQQKGVFWYYLVAHNTIEQRLCELLQKKQADANAVLDGIASSAGFDVFDALLEEIRLGKVK